MKPYTTLKRIFYVKTRIIISLVLLTSSPLNAMKHPSMRLLKNPQLEPLSLKPTALPPLPSSDQTPFASQNITIRIKNNLAEGLLIQAFYKGGDLEYTSVREVELPDIRSFNFPVIKKSNNTLLKLIGLKFFDRTKRMTLLREFSYHDISSRKIPKELSFTAHRSTKKELPPLNEIKLKKTFDSDPSSSIDRTSEGFKSPTSLSSGSSLSLESLPEDVEEKV